MASHLRAAPVRYGGIVADRKDHAGDEAIRPFIPLAAPHDDDPDGPIRRQYGIEVSLVLLPGDKPCDWLGRRSGPLGRVVGAYDITIGRIDRRHRCGKPQAEPEQRSDESKEETGAGAHRQAYLPQVSRHRHEKRPPLRATTFG
jgi:hypothetical protein